jgi:hypothetical protein
MPTMKKTQPGRADKRLTGSASRRACLVLLLGLIPVLGLAATTPKPTKRVLPVKTVPLTSTAKHLSEKSTTIKQLTQSGYSLKSPKVMQTRARVSDTGELLKNCDDVTVRDRLLIDDLGNLRQEAK